MKWAPVFGPMVKAGRKERNAKRTQKREQSGQSSLFERTITDDVARVVARRNVCRGGMRFGGANRLRSLVAPPTEIGTIRQDPSAIKLPKY